ncbi:hypothetical protein pb186bvf_009578 [Paramecium bursaria]
MYGPVNGNPPPMVQQGMAYVQQGFGMAQNMMAKFQGDPFAGIECMTINQTPEWLECLCPCVGEKRNFYYFSASDPTGAVMNMPLGRCEEFSECPGRFFCQCWRGFHMKFLSTNGQDLFQARRQYKIPAVCCCPCDRPELEVRNNDTLIGYVENPYMCCGRSECSFPIMEELNILDEQRNIKFYISGECVQCGYCARLTLFPRCPEPCSKIYFNIYNMHKQIVGSIINVQMIVYINRFNGCVQEYCSKADKFVINFPPGCTFYDKALIIMAMITIDYDIFEYTFCNLP